MLAEPCLSGASDMRGVERNTLAEEEESLGGPARTLLGAA